MPRYFVDTWFLVARFDRADDQHAAAMAIDRRVGRSVMVSHDGVMTEFLAYVAAYDSHNRRGAVEFVRDFMRRYLVVESGRPLFLRALDLYARRLDKEYSLVDCMSMVSMRDLGLTHVLTNDHHFRQEGFTVVNE